MEIVVILSVLMTDNFIDGREFRSLTDNEIKEMVQVIGITKKISRFVHEVCWYSVNLY